MAKKSYNRMGQVPYNLDEMINIFYDGKITPDVYPHAKYLYCMDVLTDMHKSTWFDSNATWFHWLDNKLNDYIYNNYRYRPFLDSVIGDYIDPFSNYCYYEITPFYSGFAWSDNEEWDELSKKISNICHNVFLANEEKYKKMFETMTKEFHPEWNVDGTTTTTRLLQKEGKEENAQSGKIYYDKAGKEETTQSGKIYYDKAGKEKNSESENTKLEHRGNITKDFLGTESNEKTGMRDLTKTGGTLEMTAKTAFNSGNSQLTETHQKLYGDNDNIDNERERETFTNYKDTKAFNQRQDKDTFTNDDITTRGTKNTLEFEGRKDTTEFDNKKDTLEFTNRKDTTEFDNRKDTLEYIGRKDRENITEVRQGNIGVVSTVKLLEENWELGEFANYIKVVSEDLMNAFTSRTY